MNKNSNDITLADLLPTDRKYLMDDEAKVGQITFTPAEKRELLKTINTPGWAIIKGVYVKQRLVQVAVASVNVSQSAEYLIRTNVGKLIATAVVMVWNFVTRKWLLDDTHTNATNRLKKKENRLSPEELEAKWENSFSHKLGVWSLEHTPKGWPK